MRLPLSDPDLLREHAFIAGRWCDADDGTRCEVRNPANGNLLGHVPDMGATETRAAIDAAHAAFPAWSRRTAKERAQVLRRMADLNLGNQTMKAISFHSGDDEVALYTRDANQKRLADDAISALSAWELSHSEDDVRQKEG